MRVSNKSKTAYAEIDSLPGCSQIAVSHAAFVNPRHRGHGVGDAAHKERLALMVDLGYDYTICTVDTKNTAQLQILAKNGWTRLSSFDSLKTGNTVAIYGRTL